VRNNETRHRGVKGGGGKSVLGDAGGKWQVKGRVIDGHAGRFWD